MVSGPIELTCVDMIVAITNDNNYQYVSDYNVIKKTVELTNSILEACIVKGRDLSTVSEILIEKYKDDEKLYILSGMVPEVITNGQTEKEEINTTND